MAQIAPESTTLNYAKLHSELKYLGKTPPNMLNILLVLLTFSYSGTFGFYISSFSSSIYLDDWLATITTSFLVAKIWMVPLSELQAINLQTGSKEREYISA